MIAHTPSPGIHRIALRRILALASSALLCIFMLPAVSADADSASTLTIVGTSDVSDSGLMPNLIQPEFHAAFPGFTFKYTGTATGTAINNAENGTGGPSVLIVHAASLENQFVAQGFSQEQYGRAIFTNDFVLGGPTGDPAGVAANGAHNIVQAFADVATAGNNGGGTPLVTFVSRGGTPGTTVQEHQIWQLVGAVNPQPAGLLLCTVNATDGGGEVPVATGVVPASGDACPNRGVTPTEASGDYPPWYVATADTQGPNVVAANTCNGFQSPTGTSCYVFTDRGTFDYLASGVDPAGAIPGLKVLTSQNSASAPGGANELTNYFHAYIINPAKPGETVNLTAATDFVNFLTSPPFQGQLKTYLDDTTDTLGPPFVADASPTITASGFPGVDAAGKRVTVTGTVTNAEPGFPALAGKTVSVDEVEGGIPVAVASGTTGASGSYSISFVPSSSGSYQVATGQIAQIENATLSPPFGDLLSPAATAPVSMNVQASVIISTANLSPGGVTVSGKVAPGAPDANAKVAILARPQGSKGRFTDVGGASLATGQSSYVVSGGLRPGKWQIEVSFQDPGQLLGATSGTKNRTVPTASTAVSFKRITVSKGALTVSGTLSQPPTANGAPVELFGLRTVTVNKTKSGRSPDLARSASVAFPQIAKTTVRNGRTTFTIRAMLRRGYRWVLQLEYVQRGQPSSFSRLSSIDVH